VSECISRPEGAEDSLRPFRAHRSILETQGVALGWSASALSAPESKRRHSAAVQSLEPMTLKESERHHTCKTLEEAWITAGPRGTAVHLGMKSSKVYLRMRKPEISRTLNPQRRNFARVEMRKRCSIVEELSARHAFADAICGIHEE